jgi:hypothetical protein
LEHGLELDVDVRGGADHRSGPDIPGTQVNSVCSARGNNVYSLAGDNKQFNSFAGKRVKVTSNVTGTKIAVQLDGLWRKSEHSSTLPVEIRVPVDQEEL